MYVTYCHSIITMYLIENYSIDRLLSSDQIPVYMRALMDLVPTVIQVGLCMYSVAEVQLRLVL